MAEGQFTGQRAGYLYTSDAGTVYLIQTDKTLGDLSECGLTPANQTNVVGTTPMPSRFSPRVSFWQATLNGRQVRKALICNRSSTLIDNNSPTAITIDGVTGSTTGRRGEKMSFLSLPAVLPPAP